MGQSDDSVITKHTLVKAEQIEVNGE